MTAPRGSQERRAFRRLAERIDGALFQPVDGASLVYFRIAFGFIMLVEVWRFFRHDWIRWDYLDPAFHFTYEGFAWVRPWPGDGLYWHFAGLGLLSAMIMLGLFYRLACVLFLLGFAYVFLLDQTRYLNHFVLVIMIALLMAVVPANRAFSLDTVLRPDLRRRDVPGWSVWLIRLQFEVMYLYAGIVKVNADWLRLEPMSMWLARRDYMPLVGPLFDTDWMAAVTSYGSILLHLVGAPLLLFRRTRRYVIVVYLLFHLTNHFLFQIGIFPWLAIAGTLMFLSPDWPRRLLVRLAGFARRRSDAAPDRSPEDWPAPSPVRRRVILALAAAWLAFQVLVPLRHWLYPGNPSWTEEGHRFAWMMKLRDKDAVAVFTVRDPATGRSWRVDNSRFLEPWQERKMATWPQLIRQFAHHLAEVWARRHGVADAEVRARACVSLNGRPPQLLVDPTVDLAGLRYSWLPDSWILPLRQPFERPPDRRGRHDLSC